MNTALSIILGTFLGGVAWGQQAMTLKQFQELTAAHGDDIALRPELAALPFWKESRGNYTIKYQDGKKIRWECSQTAKTVSGKFIIFAITVANSTTSDYSIIGYDERASTIRHWSISDGALVHGTTILNAKKKVFAETSSSPGGEIGISVAAFSDNELSYRSQIFKNGVLFSSAEWDERSVAGPNKTEQAGANQPATKPADKPVVKDKPSNPTSKDGPR